jgi:hypothetical protein
MNANGKQIKQKLARELWRFLIYFSFLAVFFCSLTTYKRLILGEYSIDYLHYGYGLIYALILSKVIMLGESLGLGKTFENKPLIITVLYKTVVFSLFVFIFSVIEHFLTGFFRGRGFAEVYQEFMDKSLDEILAKILVVFCVFVLFFAFLEIAYLIGEDKLLKLFFSKTARKDSELH